MIIAAKKPKAECLLVQMLLRLSSFEVYVPLQLTYQDEQIITQLAQRRDINHGFSHTPHAAARVAQGSGVSRHKHAGRQAPKDLPAGVSNA